MKGLRSNALWAFEPVDEGGLFPRAIFSAGRLDANLGGRGWYFRFRLVSLLGGVGFLFARRDIRAFPPYPKHLLTEVELVILGRPLPNNEGNRVLFWVTNRGRVVPQ
jgi:hypothetical protein